MRRVSYPVVDCLEAALTSGEAVGIDNCCAVFTLADIAAACGAAITHVKPHVALYNQAARDPVIARAIAAGLGRWRTGAGSVWSPPQINDVVLVGLAGSPMV